MDHVRHNKMFLITGASSSIGKALMKALDHRDHTIIAHYSSRPMSHDFISSLQAKIVPICADFSHEESCEKFVQELLTIAPLGFYGYVHLPAAKMDFKRLKSIVWSDVDRDMNIQVRSATKICQTFLPISAKSKNPTRVVFVLSSVVCGMPPKNVIPYTVVKYALLGLMRGLAAEYSGTSITVNALSPSMIDSEFLSNVPTKLKEIVSQNHPLGRLATPEDIVPMALSLLSLNSGYVTGVNVPMSGGVVL